MNIPEITKACADPIARNVAVMLATSHEYKKPNILGALSLVKNYKWELTNEKVKNIEGIDKPIDTSKVLDIAKKIKNTEPKPLIVVNKIHDIKPQSYGKKILLDGHHRLEALKLNEAEETPVYLGTYTGDAEKPAEELLKRSYFGGGKMNKVAMYKEAIYKEAGLASTFARKSLPGAVIGAGIGALKNKEDRKRGAIKGGLIGGTISGATGTIGKYLTKPRRTILTPRTFSDELRGEAAKYNKLGNPYYRKYIQNKYQGLSDIPQPKTLSQMDTLLKRYDSSHKPRYI